MLAKNRTKGNWKIADLNQRGEVTAHDHPEVTAHDHPVFEFRQYDYRICFLNHCAIRGPDSKL